MFKSKSSQVMHQAINKIKNDWTQLHTDASQEQNCVNSEIYLSFSWCFLSSEPLGISVYV